MSLPPMTQSWDHFDEKTSRLTDGLLLPEPDYLFCCIGTNDFQDEGEKRIQMDITAAYIKWLTSARNACPKTHIFCITPPIGWHVREVASAVEEHNAKGDSKIHLIDMAPLQYGFSDKNTATQFAPDGCHPTVYGNAMLGSFIAAKAQKILSRFPE
jgi:lysophospholipase L1-like esterase